MKGVTKTGNYTLAFTILALVSGCTSRKQGPTVYYHRPAPVAYAGGTSMRQEQYTRSSSSAVTSSTFTPGQTNVVVPLFRESLNVGKREVDAGSVRLRKIVKTETVNQPIELRHEEVVIDRDTGTGQGGESEILSQPFQEQETVIPLKREVAVVEKQTVPAGRVVVQTRYAGQQTNVQAQVRREDVDVNKGNAQNVIIGQNVQASGASEGAGGQSSGSGSSVAGGTITDPIMLSSSDDPSTLAGRPVKLFGLKVRQVMGDRTFVVSSDNGQPLYVVNTGETVNAQPGDVMNITGTVRQSSGLESEAGLTGDAAEALKSQPFYIEAQKVQSSSK